MPIVPTHGTDQRCRILSHQLIGWNRLPLPHLLEKSAVARLISNPLGLVSRLCNSQPVNGPAGQDTASLLAARRGL
jgi:hypothetical protein